MQRLILIWLFIFLFISCSKEKKTYCANCTELTIGTQAYFCGSSMVVDVYISDKESFDPGNPTLQWECHKEEQIP